MAFSWVLREHILEHQRCLKSKNLQFYGPIVNVIEKTLLVEASVTTTLSFWFVVVTVHHNPDRQDQTPQRAEHVCQNRDPQRRRDFHKREVFELLALPVLLNLRDHILDMTHQLELSILERVALDIALEILTLGPRDHARPGHIALVVDSDQRDEFVLVATTQVLLLPVTSLLGLITEHHHKHPHLVLAPQPGICLTENQLSSARICTNVPQHTLLLVAMRDRWVIVEAVAILDLDRDIFPLNQIVLTLHTVLVLVLSGDRDERLGILVPLHVIPIPILGVEVALHVDQHGFAPEIHKLIELSLADRGLDPVGIRHL